jgi:hypothetical protein
MILVSAWTRRLWTLQEGALAKKLYFKFADEFLEMDKATLIQTCEMTVLCQEEPLQYLPIASAVSNLWQYWKTAKLDQPRQLLLSFSNALSFRETSVAVDEPLCLSTLAGLDMEELLKAPDEERMAAFWSLLPALSVQVIFWSGPKLEQKGYRWAPASFLHQSGAVLLDIDVKSTLEAEEASSATLTEKGLCFSCPGILLNTWRANINHFWMRDQLQRWFRFSLSDSRTIDLPKEEDGDTMTLVLIMKQCLNDSFFSQSSQRAASCVIASIYDVDEETDILFVRTLATGFLMPASDLSNRSLAHSIVSTMEVKLGVSESANHPSTPGIFLFGKPNLEASKSQTALLERHVNEVNPDDHFDDITEPLEMRTNKIRARDEGDRIAVDWGEDHYMFDGLELEPDQSWCLD